MDFRMRQLQCFLTLSELLNYGKTARALYMSQPTISFQIKSLEEAFGVKLFDRDRQQVRLTDAGYAFREYARTIIDTVDAARECLGNLHKRLRLRVSCGPVGQYVLLPAVIRKLTAEHPEFELEVMELTTEQQMARMTEGNVDALESALRTLYNDPGRRAQLGKVARRRVLERFTQEQVAQATAEVYREVAGGSRS